MATTFACAPNLRDIGGLPAGHGVTTRSGLLYRSEYLCPAADEDAALAALGIRSVIDLRSERERTSAPNDWLHGQGATLHHLDVTADFRASANPIKPLLTDPGEAGADQLMRDTYCELPHAARNAVKRACALLVAGDLPMLIHCTAGKDRTGFLCAMILLGADVPWPVVLGDYLASAERRHQNVSESTRALMAASGVTLTEEALATINGVKESYLATAMDTVAKDFGGVGTYLESLSVDRRALRARLVA